MASAPALPGAQAPLIVSSDAGGAAPSLDQVHYPWARATATWCGALLILAAGYTAAVWLIAPRFLPDDALSALSIDAFTAHVGAPMALNAVTGLAIFGMSLLALNRPSGALHRNLAAPLWAGTAGALFVMSPYALVIGLSTGSPAEVLTRTAGTSLVLLLLMYLLLLRVAPLRPLYWLFLTLVATCLVAALLAGARFALAAPVAAALYRLAARCPWRPWLLLVEFPAVVLSGTAGALALTWFATFSEVSPIFLALPSSAMSHAFGLVEITRLNLGGETGLSWQSFAMIGIGLSWAISPYALALWYGVAAVRVFDLLGRPMLGIFGATRGWSREGTPWVPWGLQPIDFLLLTGACAIGWPVWIAASDVLVVMPLLSPLALASAPYLLARCIARIDWWEVPVYGVALAGLAGYFAAFVGDGRGIQELGGAVASILIAPAALGLMFLALSVSLGKRSIRRQVVILGVLLAIAWCWGVNVTIRETEFGTSREAAPGQFLA